MIRNIEMEGRRLGKRMLQGESSKYNKREINRYINIVITQEEYEEYKKHNFRVWETKPRIDADPNEEFIPAYFLSVKVDVDSKYPPKVYLVEVEGVDEFDKAVYKTTLLSPDQYILADMTDYISADIMINNYLNKETGNYTHYLNALYLEIPTNKFRNKYGV